MMRQRSSLFGSLALAALLPLVSGGSRSGSTSAPAGSGAALSDQPLIQSKDLPAGLDLALSNGKAGPPAFDRAKIAPAKPLSDAQAGALPGAPKPTPTKPA